MILQALNDYYRRKIDDPDPAKRLPAFGLEQKEIPFLLEITQDGKLVQLRDTREMQGKKRIGRRFLVPQGVKRANNVAANLLWDTLEYVLGVDTRGRPERVAEQHAAFIARIEALPQNAREDAGIRAVLLFLPALDRARLEEESTWADALESNAVLSFRLHGESGLICQRPAVVIATLNEVAELDTPQAMCLVTGQFAPVERLHAAIKGVWGAQTSGANIISFNARAFESYGKTERQGENAPVSKAAAFAYTTALNQLLHRDSTQRIQVGDASTVFWSERSSALESTPADIFGEPAKDDPNRNTRAVGAMFEALYSGRLGGLEGDNCFHVLGLAPNAARISVRFYHRLPLRDLASRILRHFEDLKIVRGKYDLEFPSLFRLLAAVAVQGKADNIPQSLGGAVIDAVLNGPDTPYPNLWLNAAVTRCRAEQMVSYLRAAAIKACLNRQIRRHPTSSNEKEFLPMLDKDNPGTAYRMGRLFATLEKIQEEASPGLNATIRDRYYGAASSTPVAVFTTLLRLKNAHLKKLGAGRVNQFERLLSEILGVVTDFPPHLALQDQGRFALGYYHQRQDFFTPRANPSLSPAEETAP